MREPDPKTGKLERFATPLFLALVLVEFVDLIFAVDSVPAIFAITTDPFIVYTSNIFAILGLRALYFALAAMIHRFKYLKYALALVLVFIGSKIFLVGIIGKIPAVVSLSVTFGLIAGGVLVSLWKTRGQPAAGVSASILRSACCSAQGPVEEVADLGCPVAAGRPLRSKPGGSAAMSPSGLGMRMPGVSMKAKCQALGTRRRFGAGRLAATQPAWKRGTRKRSRSAT